MPWQNGQRKWPSTDDLAPPVDLRLQEYLCLAPPEAVKWSWTLCKHSVQKVCRQGTILGLNSSFSGSNLLEQVGQHPGWTGLNRAAAWLLLNRLGEDLANTLGCNTLHGVLSNEVEDLLKTSGDSIVSGLDLVGGLGLARSELVLELFCLDLLHS